MIKSSDDQAASKLPGERRAWQAPTLTVHGDVRTIAQAGGVNIPDGGGNQLS